MELIFQEEIQVLSRQQRQNSSFLGSFSLYPSFPVMSNVNCQLESLAVLNSCVCPAEAGTF